MKLKPLIAALALGVTGVAAHAADTDWGTHDLLESALSLTSGGVFNDIFTFELGVASTVASSISSVGSITPALYGIFSVGADGLIGTTDDGLASSAYSWSFGGAPTVNTAVLAAGQYYYAVFGVANGAAAYSLNSAATATPVPEPETYALLLGGLGVVGFVARRRRAD